MDAAAIMMPAIHQSRLKFSSIGHTIVSRYVTISYLNPFMPSVKVCACLKENEIKNCLIYVKYSLCLSLHSAIIAFSLFPSIFPLYSLFISNCRTVSSFGAVCMLSTKDPFYFFFAILVFRTRKLFQKGPIQFKMDLSNE